MQQRQGGDEQHRYQCHGRDYITQYYRAKARRWLKREGHKLHRYGKS